VRHYLRRTWTHVEGTQFGAATPNPARAWPVPLRAFGFGVPIGTLGGLIGLGGAEFRLPVLTGVLGYRPRQALAVNLAVSLITVLAAAIIRGSTLQWQPVVELLPVAAAMTTGAVLTAYAGIGIVHRLPETGLRRLILVLLVGIGIALLVEAFLPRGGSGLLGPHGPVALLVAGLCGLAIGMVSSLLGVAARHARRGTYRDRGDLTGTILPMGVGSVIGAVLGGLLVGIAPDAALKVLLGVILIGSATRVFRH
jgi:uncharacterized membrane protein YfcA